jgi:hypothetical protein
VKTVYTMACGRLLSSIDMYFLKSVANMKEIYDIENNA